MSYVKRLRQELIRYSLALDSLNKGSNQLAIKAIQLGELTNEQFRHGLTERLRNAYERASGHRISASVKGLAVGVLSGGQLPEDVVDSFYHEVF